MHVRPPRLPPVFLVLSLVWAALTAGLRIAEGNDHPLAPAETSSPRGTLSSFLNTIDEIYADLKANPPSGAQRARVRRLIAKVSSCLDLSEVAPSLADSKGRQAAVNLKEVLDRIPLPEANEIPGAEEVVAEQLTRWRLPDSEIAITKRAAGPHAGEWVFSAETVARSDGFYDLIKDLPYRPDAGSPGLHELYVESPGWMIPQGWIRDLPDWARGRVWDVAIWQWTAAFLLLAVGFGLGGGGFVIARNSTARGGLVQLLVSLSAPIIVIAICVVLDELFTNQLRIIGDVLFLTKSAFRVGIFAGCIMFVQAVMTRIGEAVIRSRRLRPGTIDTQVVRLGFRILTGLAIAWMVILGADSMGISVAPLIAGLGVGGLALALAAQHTVENFIAGLVLFADKPVRIGDTCQFGEHRGTVEQIGLRSTRIRSLDRSLVSIPNADFAKLRLVNYSRRDMILLKTTLGLRYETTPDQLRHVLAGLRHLLTTHPRIAADSVRVRFVGYGAYSLDIEVFALAETNDWPIFLAIQEDVLLEVMDVVQGSGCGFAFPSQTHYTASDAGVDAEVRQAAEAKISAMRAAGGLAMAGFLVKPEQATTGEREPDRRLHRPAA
jgi:MscS family membrane protein